MVRYRLGGEFCFFVGRGEIVIFVWRMFGLGNFFFFHVFSFFSSFSFDCKVGKVGKVH